MKYKPFCSTEIVFSNYEQLKQRILSLGAKNVVFVLSETAAYRWGVEPLISAMQTLCESWQGNFIWIKDVVSNPTQKDVINCLNNIGNRHVDVIVAFGGGSAIDLAKVIRAFYNVDKNASYTINEITDNIKNKRYPSTEDINIIAIPSTAGTGSEVTQWATIWDKNRTGKFSVDHYMLKPKLAIIVPELTLSMPAKMTLSTGLDAMCQAIESYWSRHTTPIVQEIAYRAVELIVKNLRNAIKDPFDINVRENLCRASVLAGLAFSQTRTTACHSISYPLTMLHDIPHGLAAAITLDPVGRINKGSFPNHIQLYRLFDDNGGILNWIDIVSEDVVKMRLSTFGITQKDIPIIADNAFTGGRMDNNPVDLSRADVVRILESVL